MIYKFLTKVVFVTTFLFSSQIFAVTASDIENANPEGQTVEFWVQYSDERLDFMKARAERFEAETILPFSNPSNPPKASNSPAQFPIKG